MPVPPQRLCRNLDARRRSLGRISKRCALPVVALRQNSRHQSQARHRSVRRERNECRSPFACCARESNHFRSRWLRSGENDYSEASAPQKLLRRAKRIPAIGRPHEDWAFLPELSGDCPQSIDPGRALPGRSSRVTGGAEDGGGSALGHPYRESSAGQPASRQNRIEQLDACRDRLCRTMRDRSSIRKPLLEQRAKKGRGGQSVLGVKELILFYTEETPKANKPQIRPSHRLDPESPEFSVHSF